MEEDDYRTYPRTTIGQRCVATCALLAILGFVMSLWSSKEPIHAIMQSALWLAVCGVCLYAAIKDVPLIEPREVDEFQGRLLAASVGSCTCGIMSPEIKYHDEKCPHRLYHELIDFLEPYGGVRTQFNHSERKAPIHEKQ